jgi:hypothetical protein
VITESLLKFVFHQDVIKPQRLVLRVSTHSCFQIFFRLMTDAPDKHICFIHAKLGAAPGWGAASRLVSIVGKQFAE